MTLGECGSVSLRDVKWLGKAEGMEGKGEMESYRERFAYVMEGDGREEARGRGAGRKCLLKD